MNCAKSERRKMMATENFKLLAALFVILGIEIFLGSAVAQQSADPQNIQDQANAADVAAYEAQLKQFDAARKIFEKMATEYWKAVADKRRARTVKRSEKPTPTLEDYVLTQPPVYTGPPRPTPPPSLRPKIEVPPPKYVPIIADFLRNAEIEFHFMPDRPTEREFKRAYAKAAAVAGLSKDQIVRIYAFETGGNAGYDLQAGFEGNKPDAHAISTALGYNQLLHANTIELLAAKGDKFVSALQAKVNKARSAKKQLLRKKIAILQEMIAFTRSVPDDWIDHVRIANTPKGLGIHALNLDIDIGPLLQVENLATSVAFARRLGIERPLTAAELEMMNLAGDGSGFDIIRMPDSLRGHVPTANFFERNGYEANPIVIRNNTVAKLLAATNAEMDENSKLPGAKALAAAF
jgi:hypothetical protein